MHTVPPELLTEDGLEARAAELERRIAREWVRFAITEALLFGVPLLIVLAFHVADGFSRSTLIALAIVAGAAWIAFTLYWVYARVRPLQRELESLEHAVGLSS
jgi:hypothetical protein